IALFAGFVPVDAPRYAMVVVIEDGHSRKNGKTLTSGGELAAPVFRKVALNSLSNTTL
ncbi:TPA: penicillin-binding transpeptidase domain-containing protein, partial [Legionella pneumophila]